MPPAFSSFSPEQQRDSIRPAEAWPLLHVTWQPDRQVLLCDIRHRAANVDVKLVPLLGSAVYVSPHPWWYVLVKSYASELELDALRDHAPQHAWYPFPELFTKFVTWAATTTTAQRREFLQACRAHISDFGDGPVSSVDFMGLLDLLAGTESVKPVLLRVCTLHYLASWAAQRDGLTLACPRLTRDQKENDKVGWSFGATPLTAREWQNELQRHEKSGALLAADARARLTTLTASAALKHGQLSTPTSPSWKAVLRAGATLEDEDVVRQVEGLRTIPDSAAPVAAPALLALIKDGEFDLGSRVAVQLSTLKTAAELSLAAQSAWAACTAPERARFRVQLSDYIKEVMAVYRPAVDAATTNATLVRLAPVVQSGVQRGYTSWPGAAAAISRCEHLPTSVIGPLSQAVNLETFRASLRDTRTFSTQLPSMRP